MVATPSKLVTVTYAGRIEVADGKNPRSLYQHQIQAIQALDRINRKPFKGLLVLPTGGGKTLTAMHWLLRNFINENKKVLWIAHRHELLNQARETLENHAYADVVSKRDCFRYRVISGSPEHDRPVNIQSDDDILIASKDSLNSGINYLLNQWVKDASEILLVIDEAHHATAKTYRKLIKTLEEALNHKTFKVLGLTATPFRTEDSEQGWLKQVFPDDIIFKEDLRTLITRKILADPVFEEMPTEIDLSKELTAKDIKAIQAFDSIPERIAKQIAKNGKRNSCIVEHYVKNKDKYKQLLVFVGSVSQAIALNALFQERKIQSDFVVSSIRDAATGATISPVENKRKLEQFRKGELSVLVNVEIVTEGVDLPNVQTVFLTRPTTSTTLMTQMIGRGLRGQKAGGTEQAYIVSFIDDWKNRINWVNPKALIDGIEIIDEASSSHKSQVQLVSIQMMEEFARIINDLEDTEGIEKLPFLKRLPVGIYRFSVLQPLDESGDQVGRNHEILLYEETEEAYDAFAHDLDSLFEGLQLGEREDLTDAELESLFAQVKADYFAKGNYLIGYHDEDVKNILRFYAQTNLRPRFLSFEARGNCNLTEVARYILEEDLSVRKRMEYENSLWNDPEAFWQVLFGYNQNYFDRLLDIELRRIANPEQSQQELPRTIPDKREIEKLSLYQIKQLDFPHYRDLREKVFAKHTDKDGFITCALRGFRSKKRIYFQIDHITPMSEGGLSIAENLRVLERKVHTEVTRKQNLERTSKNQSSCQ